MPNLEEEFSEMPEDEDTKEVWEALKKLIEEKRILSLNLNKTGEELFEGWNDWTGNEEFIL